MTRTVRRFRVFGDCPSRVGPFVLGHVLTSCWLLLMKRTVAGCRCMSIMHLQEAPTRARSCPHRQRCASVHPPHTFELSSTRKCFQCRYLHMRRRGWRPRHRGASSEPGNADARLPSFPQHLPGQVRIMFCCTWKPTKPILQSCILQWRCPALQGGGNGGGMSGA